MRVVATGAELRAVSRERTTVVMTMGALHDGHAELIRQARGVAGPTGTVVVTIFANPTQFGAGEDFDRYPRTMDADLERCAAAGADLVLAPDVVEVYGNATGFGPDAVTIDPGPLGGILEGRTRQGHFRGMLTVVAKLMALTDADDALFGEKDYQQLVLIRRMVADLSMPVVVHGVETVREPDGLAMSSRNRYLSDQERQWAAAVPAALQAVRAALRDGVHAGLAAGHAVLAATPEVVVDYLEVTDPDLGPAPDRGPARVLIAAKVGSTRLIDNTAAEVGAP